MKLENLKIEAGLKADFMAAKQRHADHLGLKSLTINDFLRVLMTTYRDKAQ